MAVLCTLIRENVGAASSSNECWDSFTFSHNTPALQRQLDVFEEGPEERAFRGLPRVMHGIT